MCFSPAHLRLSLKASLASSWTFKACRVVPIMLWQSAWQGDEIQRGNKKISRNLERKWWNLKNKWWNLEKLREEMMKCKGQNMKFREEQIKLREEQIKLWEHVLQTYFLQCPKIRSFKISPGQRSRHPVPLWTPRGHRRSREGHPRTPPGRCTHLIRLKRRCMSDQYEWWL